jgi:hypothetical protein
VAIDIGDVTGGGDGSGIVHMPLLVSRVPDSIMSPILLRMTTLCGANVAVQPASHSCAMESSEWFTSWGNTWHRVACSGNDGIVKVPTCDDWMVSPLGKLTTSGVETVCFCDSGTSLET